MPNPPVLAAAALSLALLAGPAWAQNSNGDIALTTSSYGAMTCGQFIGLGAGKRDGIVRQMTAQAPARSLSGPTITPETDSDGNLLENQTPPLDTPLSAGTLVSACQAASPATTLRDAYSAENSNLPGDE